MTPREMLTIPMQENDADALTVGGYLQTLLKTLWSEEESFNSKRPFGNSGWQHDLYAPLIKAGAATGTLDEDGYVEDQGDADAVVHEIINALFAEQASIEEVNALTVAALRREINRIEQG